MIVKRKSRSRLGTYFKSCAVRETISLFSTCERICKSNRSYFGVGVPITSSSLSSTRDNFTTLYYLRGMS